MSSSNIVGSKSLNKSCIALGFLSENFLIIRKIRRENMSFFYILNNKDQLLKIVDMKSIFRK